MNRRQRNKLSASIIILIFLLTMISVTVQSHQYIHTSESIVSCNDATIVAEQFLISKHKQYEYTIKSNDILMDSTNQIKIGYLFHLHPIGYIIVAPSRYISPVIAYSFTSNADMSIPNPLRTILSLDISSRLQHHTLISDQLIESNQQQWHSLLDDTIEKTSCTLFQQWPPEGSTPTEGWIETQWHQEEPYNNFCPYDSDEGLRTLAGCPAITMGQILNYHQTTKGVRFNDSDDYYHRFTDFYWIDDDYESYDFPSFPMLNTYLDTIEQHFESNTPLTDDDKAALVFACGVAAEQIYSPQASGTLGVDQAIDAYDRFHCDTATLYYKPDNTIYDKIIDNIKLGLPVHFAVVTTGWDAGHNLVIDGYNTDDYYHLNFGWGGSYDGWYIIPESIPFELTVIEGVILDIEQKETAEDLSVSGTINWQDMTGGQEVHASFTIQNTGENNSELSWEIVSIPSWGQWTITPNKGEHMTPADGEVEISVSCVLPNEKRKEYSDTITVINSNNPGDRGYIPISLSLTKQKDREPLLWNFIQYYISMLQDIFDKWET